ncbi:orotidine-5'-phosphate decarboxylase [Patescibacteria group bacterium]|nr:orotidine-5'-phosphate decarboxylase [Patescibacteria group bacterium]
MPVSKDRLQLTFSERAELASCALARHLFGLMSEKETNLCVALDETDPERFMSLAAALGPEIAVLKTHVDTLEHFTGKMTVELATLAREHNFLIFEDRKFSDIGKTVRNQYTKGIFHIVEWADIVNAHAISGPGIVQGLREEVENYDMLDKRAVLLLAQMSSKDNLIDDDYTERVVKVAVENEDFVMGFIGAGASKVPLLASLAPPGFIIMSPGIKIGGGNDKLGQQYTSPETLVEAGADVLIVGSDIYNHASPLDQAQKYREICWEAYQARISEPKVARTKPDKKPTKNHAAKKTTP